MRDLKLLFWLAVGDGLLALAIMAFAIRREGTAPLPLQITTYALFFAALVSFFPTTLYRY